MIKFELHNDVCVISGQLTQKDVTELWPQRDHLIDNKASILDLSKLVFSDSSGLAFIITLWQEFISQQGELKMVSPSPQVNNLIQLYNLQSAFA